MIANFLKYHCVVAIILFVMGFGLSSGYADWSIGIGVSDEREHRHHDFTERHAGYREYEEHHFAHFHEHPHYGFEEPFLPIGVNSFWLGGNRYYYNDGLYYVRDGFNYVVVAPPVGARVSSIPIDFQPIFINGQLYYTCDGVYYKHASFGGYEVVPQPVVYAEPQPIIVTQPRQISVVTNPSVVQATTVNDSENSFPVNIPNGTGAYTTVMIKKSGTGYVGPQGEYYANFPSVAQLKAMYAK